MATNEEENVLSHQDNAPCHKSIAMIAKLYELHLELLPYPPYSLDMAPEATGCLQTSKDLAPMKK